jgi:hypothetical protein
VNALCRHDMFIFGNRTQQRQLKVQVPLGHFGKAVVNAADIGGCACPVNGQEHRAAEFVKPQHLQQREGLCLRLGLRRDDKDQRPGQHAAGNHTAR